MASRKCLKRRKKSAKRQAKFWEGSKWFSAARRGALIAPKRARPEPLQCFRVNPPMRSWRPCALLCVAFQALDFLPQYLYRCEGTDALDGNVNVIRKAFVGPLALQLTGFWTRVLKRLSKPLLRVGIVVHQFIFPVGCGVRAVAMPGCKNGPAHWRRSSRQGLHSHRYQ